MLLKCYVTVLCDARESCAWLVTVPKRADCIASSQRIRTPFYPLQQDMNLYDTTYCELGLSVVAHTCIPGLAGVEHNSAEYLHLLIEALELSFADTQWYCADPSKVEVPIESLLSKEYASSRRKLITPGR